MKIYYLDKNEFFKHYDKSFLQKFSDGQDFKSEKRFYEYTIGRFLVKSVAEKVYNLSDTEIIIQNNKPKFKTANLHFSISHSGHYIAVAFDSADCGLDIEEIKSRNIAGLLRRYEKDFNTLEDFYKFWTEYEAEIKLQQKTQDKYSCVFQNNYMLTVVSANPISSPPSCINFLDV